jgi:hypothetical protein
VKRRAMRLAVLWNAFHKQCLARGYHADNSSADEKTPFESRSCVKCRNKFGYFEYLLMKQSQIYIGSTSFKLADISIDDINEFLDTYVNPATKSINYAKVMAAIRSFKTKELPRHE